MTTLIHLLPSTIVQPSWRSLLFISYRVVSDHHLEGPVFEEHLNLIMSLTCSRWSSTLPSHLEGIQLILLPWPAHSCFCSSLTSLALSVPGSCSFSDFRSYALAIPSVLHFVSHCHMTHYSPPDSEVCSNVDPSWINTYIYIYIYVFLHFYIPTCIMWEYVPCSWFWSDCNLNGQK